MHPPRLRRHRRAALEHGLEDCLRIGGTWVHLRLCMDCGHVGCCDNSPNRRCHWRTSTPIGIIRSSGRMSPARVGGVTSTISCSTSPALRRRRRIRDRRLTCRQWVAEMLGVDFPILAFSHCRDAVVVVMNAGGFGLSVAARAHPQLFEQSIPTWIDDEVKGKAYGVGNNLRRHTGTRSATTARSSTVANCSPACFPRTSSASSNQILRQDEVPELLVEVDEAVEPSKCVRGRVGGLLDVVFGIRSGWSPVRSVLLPPLDGGPGQGGRVPGRRARRHRRARPPPGGSPAST